RGKLLHALRHPDQRSHRIAQGRRLDQALERGDEPRIVLANRPATATGTANLPLRQRLCIEILLAAIYRRAGEPGDFRDDHQTASTRAPHLPRRKQAPPSLVEPRADGIPSQPNGGLVDHATDLPRFAENRNPQHPSQSDAGSADYDSVIVRSVLNGTVEDAIADADTKRRVELHLDPSGFQLRRRMDGLLLIHPRTPESI